MVLAQDVVVDASDIQQARRRLEGIAWTTPLVPAGRHEDGEIHLKLECLQRMGSFKVRGAWNRMSQATEKERKAGFVTVSAGNHGQAVAWSAKRLQAPCTVWVPGTAVQRKVDAIKDLGATVRTMPHEEIMKAMTEDRFAHGPQTFIHPFGDRHVVAGQATIGIEIIEALPTTQTVLVPVGGGGLALGIAIAAKGLSRHVRVYGVQAANAAPLARAWISHRPEEVPTPKTIADGIAASRVFDYMLPHLLKNLDGVFTVGEDAMRDAIRHLAAESHVVAEPAGAASLAAARQHASDLPKPIVCVVSGGNVAPQLLRDVLAA